MSRIIKKISASFLLILMIFSVAFNVLYYGVSAYNNNLDEWNTAGWLTFNNGDCETRIEIVSCIGTKRIDANNEHYIDCTEMKDDKKILGEIHIEDNNIYIDDNTLDKFIFDNDYLDFEASSMSDNRFAYTIKLKNNITYLPEDLSIGIEAIRPAGRCNVGTTILHLKNSNSITINAIDISFTGNTIANDTYDWSDDKNTTAKVNLNNIISTDNQEINLSIKLEGFKDKAYVLKSPYPVSISISLERDNKPTVSKGTIKIYNENKLIKSKQITFLGIEETGLSHISLIQGENNIVPGNNKIGTINYTSTDEIKLSFSLKTKETITVNNIGLMGYTASTIRSNGNDISCIFIKGKEEQEIKVNEDEVRGKTETTLTIRTKSNGEKSFSIPIINTPKDTKLIKEVRGEMKENGKYYIYVFLNEEREEKYTIDWALKNISIENADPLKLEIKTVTDNNNAIAFEVTNATELIGNTYKRDIVAKYNGEEVDRKDATISISDGEFDLIIAGQTVINSAKQEYKEQCIYAPVVEPLKNMGDGSIYLYESYLEDYSGNPVQKNNNAVFCAGYGYHLKPGYSNFFDATEENVENYLKELYVLIYLNEIPEYKSEYSDWESQTLKYYVMNSYIWMSKLSKNNTAFPTDGFTFKQLLQDAETAADKALENGGILTLKNGKKVKIKPENLSLTRYECIDTTSGWTTNEVQPFITFDYDFNDGPSIELQKVDEDGNPLEATFAVFESKEAKTNGIAWYKLDEYTTDKETGLTDIIPIAEGTYAIFETEAPEGYKPTNQYAIVTVDKEGKFTYQILQAPADSIDKNGYITVTKFTDGEEYRLGEEYHIGDGTEVTEELDWNSAETVGEEDVLLLVVTNKTGVPPLKIYKVDESGELIKKEVTFDLYEKTLESLKDISFYSMIVGNQAEDAKRDTITITTGESELIDLPDIEKLNNGESKIFYLIETTPPTGYKEPNYFIKITATKDENGNITLESEAIANKEGEEPQNAPEKMEISGNVYTLTIVNNSGEPSLKIHKIDQDGNPIKEKVTFDLYDIGSLTEELGNASYNDITGSGLTPTKITITTGESEPIELPNIKAGQTRIYYLIENPLEGYQEPNYYIKLEVTTNENNKIIFNAAKTVLCRPKKDGEDVINPAEAKLNGNTIEITVENIKKKDLKIQIHKTDSAGNALSGMEFELTVRATDLSIEPIRKKYVTNTDGNISDTWDRDKLETGKEYYLIISETTVKPYKYLATNLTFKINEDETIEITKQPSDSRVTVNVKSDSNNHIFSFSVVNYEEDEEVQEGTAQFPLLMTISGKVWLDEPSGKNSEANGKYDAGNDKLLEGIKVTVYETDGTPAKFASVTEINDKLQLSKNSRYLTTTLRKKIDEQISKIPPDPNNITTDKNGEFTIGGLDPNNKYTIEFTYDGMRYSEIKASINVEGSLTNASITVESTAVEDTGKRKALNERFSEIGPYPNNYKREDGSYNIAFNHIEVEEYKKDKNNYKGNKEAMEKFIADTEITAQIKGIGGILSEAEEAIKAHNQDAYASKDTNFVFPVVKLSILDDTEYVKDDENPTIEITNVEIKDGKVVSANIIKEDRYKKPDTNNWENSEKVKIRAFNNIVGYALIEKEKGMMQETNKNGACPLHSIGSQSLGAYTDEELRIYYKYQKNYGTEETLKSRGKSYEKCTSEKHGSWIDGEFHSGSADTGIQKTYYGPMAGSKILFGEYYIDDGYSSGVSDDGTNHTRYATFDLDSEPYLDTDNYQKGRGASEANTVKDWGWGNITGVQDNGYTTDGNEAIGKTYGQLINNIEEITNQDLCLVYRPTVDLGLFNDVQDAVVSINSKTETYVYDKRALNGGTFKFGVNKYDIQNGNKGNIEEAYADYYSKLSNSEKIENNSEMTSKEYTNYIRKEDISPNIIAGNTQNGEAEAGGYADDYPISIKVTYKIRIENQSNVSSTVTEIVDYYNSDFKVINVYEGTNSEKGKAINYNATSKYGHLNNAVREFNTIYIPINQILNNGESKYIYVELEMIEPRTKLGGNVLDSGYKTLNYAEINGYKTDIGVIDIDSVPGNIVADGKGRFANGKYEDDESKSPTLIFKKPDDGTREIIGTVFEDADKESKTNIESYMGKERKGNGELDDKDTKIVGVKVELREQGKDSDDLRATTYTNEDGQYRFYNLIPGDYIIQFTYGQDNKTILIKDFNGGSNSKSYNGQDYESTESNGDYTSAYWYINSDTRHSDAVDDIPRRNAVIQYSQELKNKQAEVFNSWKDKEKNEDLISELGTQTHMYAQTKTMTLEVENIKEHPEKTVKTEMNEKGTTYTRTYQIKNVDFGIVERERAELQITQEVAYVKITDSSGNLITEGNAGDEIKYVKWVKGKEGFVDMEIDSELLSGATLQVKYKLTVTNTSEKSSDNSNPNTIKNIQIIDYVSNNLNYDESYGENRGKWNTITVDKIKNDKLVNTTSLDYKKENDTSNKIDLSTYQTILTTTINQLAPGQNEVRYLTLEKNLSSSEESDFNYENQVEIVSSYNEKGRGDYSSIYGNLDPTTYTSRQGNLKWDPVTESTNRYFPQELTDTTVKASGAKVENPNAIRLAEKDSGNAEEVIITPPTGAKGIVLQAQHYILAITALITLAGTMILIKKYLKLSKE